MSRTDGRGDVAGAPGVAGSPSSARRRLGRKTSEAEMSRTDGRGDVAGVPGVAGIPLSARRRLGRKTSEAEMSRTDGRGDVAGMPSVAASPGSGRRKISRKTPEAELSCTDGRGDVDPGGVGDGAFAEWGTPKKRRVTTGAVTEDPTVVAPRVGLATTPEQRAKAACMGSSLVEEEGIVNIVSPPRRIREKSQVMSPSAVFGRVAGGEQGLATADAGAESSNMSAGGANHVNVLGTHGAAVRGRGGRGRGAQSAGAEPGGGEQPLRRSARIAAAVGNVRSGTSEGGGSRRGCGGGRDSAPRIVSGFGSERVENVASHERQRESEAMARASRRSAEGCRGRMTGFSGEDLDRAAGGPWQTGRR